MYILIFQCLQRFIHTICVFYICYVVLFNWYCNTQINKTILFYSTITFWIIWCVLLGQQSVLHDLFSTRFNRKTPGVRKNCGIHCISNQGIAVARQIRLLNQVRQTTSAYKSPFLATQSSCGLTTLKSFSFGLFFPMLSKCLHLGISSNLNGCCSSRHWPFPWSTDYFL